MNFLASEKALLLPTAETLETNSKPHESRRREYIEYAFLILSLLLTTCQFLVLYTSASANSHCYALLARFAHGLNISIPASLPTAIVLFAIAPYIAQPERVTVARYAVLVSYLIGSSLGAVLLLL
jgi:hypothetical protein